MNAAQIADVVELVRRNGGITVSIHDGTSPMQGYAYAVHCDKAEHIPGYSWNESHVQKFLTDNDYVFQEPGMFLGIWGNPATGDIHHTITKVTDDESLATQECQNTFQWGYYSLHGKETILV